jgi:hypothetical protein
MNFTNTIQGWIDIDREHEPVDNAIEIIDDIIIEDNPSDEELAILELSKAYILNFSELSFIEVRKLKLFVDFLVVLNGC